MGRWPAAVWEWWSVTRHDPQQARFLTRDSLRWVLRHRALTPWYLVRYWRLLRLRVTQPNLVLRGMVFLGRDAEVHCRPGYGRLELGAFTHIGDGTSIRCHEGSVRIGDKVVFGGSTVVNCYLDVEIGAACLVADCVYIVDFDHRTTDLELPIKDQGIVKSPVRIGPGTWVGAKVTVLRGAQVGRGCVLGANAVVRGRVPDYGVAVGSPARVVRNRRDDYAAAEQERAAVADIARKTEAAVARRLRGGTPCAPEPPPAGESTRSGR
ncbi:MAG TPA: acyltransferase [Pseudonocardiaceae bacterium]